MAKADTEPRSKQLLKNKAKGNTEKVEGRVGERNRPQDEESVCKQLYQQ